MDVKKIEKWADLNGFSCRSFFDTVTLSNSLEGWIIIKIRDGLYEVRHGNESGMRNPSGKLQTHRQRYVSKLDHALEGIETHQRDYGIIKSLDLINNICI